MLSLEDRDNQRLRLPEIAISLILSLSSESALTLCCLLLELQVSVFFPPNVWSLAGGGPFRLALDACAALTYKIYTHGRENRQPYSTKP